jgi:hypothetical protein
MKSVNCEVSRYTFLFLPRNFLAFGYTKYVTCEPGGFVSVVQSKWHRGVLGHNIWALVSFGTDVGDFGHHMSKFSLRVGFCSWT